MPTGAIPTQKNNNADILSYNNTNSNNTDFNADNSNANNCVNCGCLKKRKLGTRK